MSKWFVDKLSFGKDLLLAAGVVAAVAGAIVFGFANAARVLAQSAQTAYGPARFFEVASIKPDHSGGNPRGISLKDPGRLSATNVTTRILIKFAYDIKDFQLSGGPGWIDSEKYDVDAKIEDSIVEGERNLTFFQRQDLIRPMVQSLLAERFGLKVTKETKELPVYALVVGRDGPKLPEVSLGASGSPELPAGTPKPSAMPKGMAVFILRGPMSAFADALSQIRELGRVVLDQTGLKGNYDFVLQWTPTDSADLASAGAGRGAADGNVPDPSGPSIFAAIQEQLGLKLESTKGSVETIVINHIEEPSEN